MNDMSTARIIVLLVLVFLAGMQVIEVGQANPFHFVTFGPEIPGSTPPLISIYPHNNTMCSSNLTLSLHISKPLLPAPFNSTYDGLTYICVELDCEVISSYYCNKYGGAGSLGGAQAGLPEFNYSKNVSLAEGNHTINIFADGIVFANTGAFGLNSSSTVYFTVDPSIIQNSSPASPTSQVSLSPTPTVPESPGLAILPLFISVLFIAIKLRHRKTVEISVKTL